MQVGRKVPARLLAWNIWSLPWQCWGWKQGRPKKFPLYLLHFLSVVGGHLIWKAKTLHGMQRLLRASPTVLSMQPCRSSYLLFCNPTHKTETGTANRWGTTNRKPPGPIIMIRQSETLSSSRIIFSALFCACPRRCCPFYLRAAANCKIIVSQTDFPEPNRHVLTFLHPIFTVKVTYWAPLEMLL